MLPPLYAFLGGGLGALCRYGLSLWLPSTQLFSGVLLANLLGCLLMGGLSTLPLVKDHPQLSVLVLTGFLGGLTTFSSFVGDAMKAEKWGLFSAYIIASVVLGIAGFILGRWGVGILLGRALGTPM